MEHKQIIYFRANHQRSGTILIDENECKKCYKFKGCLCIDSSEEEYGPGTICKECIEEMFKNSFKEE